MGGASFPSLGVRDCHAEETSSRVPILGADHTNNEDKIPVAVLTLNMRQVNKESSNKFSPGHDPALNCLLQCPDFWPSCQFDVPFLC